MKTKILILTVVIELITLIGRFCLNLQSTRDTAFLSKYTFGIRIHHAYLGALLCIAAYCFRASLGARLREYAYIVGLSMFFSDIIHHFVFLWLIVGDPEFHLTYKK